MLLSHAFTCSIYAPRGAEDTSGIPHQTAVPNILSHKCIYSTSEVETLERSHCVCWLKACSVSCVLFWWPSSGMGWDDPETHPRQFEVLEQLLKRVSHGSDSSAFESSTRFRSVLILAQALQHCPVNSVYRFLRQRFVLQDFCTLVLKCPSTAWASQNRRFFNLFIPQAVWLVGVRRELSLVRVF